MPGLKLISERGGISVRTFGGWQIDGGETARLETTVSLIQRRYGVNIAIAALTKSFIRPRMKRF
jgi:hypothetical protein